MAWQAIVTGWDLDSPSITVGYYDDSDPPDAFGNRVFLYSRAFSRAEFGTPAELRSAVITVGQQKRAAYVRIQTIRATGAITIP